MNPPARPVAGFPVSSHAFPFPSRHAGSGHGHPLHPAQPGAPALPAPRDNRCLETIQLDRASYLPTARVRVQKCSQARSRLVAHAQRRVPLEGCGLRGNGPTDLLPRELSL